MIPLVSVVINNYNYGRYIRQAIESALTQTYKNLELVIVDDGSTDESRSVIEEYRDRAVVILKENGGQASAFNVGITQAKGDFILLLDSDDYLFREAVEVCVGTFPEGYSRIYYRLQIVDESSNPIVGTKQEMPFRIFDGDVFADLAEGGEIFWMPTSGNFFDAGKLKSALPIPEMDYRVCADAFIFVKSALLGKVRSIDRALGAYRIHASNNYYAKSRLFSDEKRLKTRIDDYYRVSELLEQTCKKLGVAYKKPDDKSFSILHMLCAGYKLNLESPYISVLGKMTLLARIIRHLRFGDDCIVKRIPQSVYLLFILVLPEKLARHLLRLRDLWKLR